MRLYLSTYLLKLNIKHHIQIFKLNDNDQIKKNKKQY